METTASDMEALQQINSGYMRSVQMSDVGWFDEHLADDFLNSNPDASLADRAQFLEHIGKPCALTNFHSEDVRIRLMGDIAIIHGRTVYGKPDGLGGTGRYTDIYARRGGRWLCIAAHVTRS